MPNFFHMPLGELSGLSGGYVFAVTVQGYFLLNFTFLEELKNSIRILCQNLPKKIPAWLTKIQQPPGQLYGLPRWHQNQTRRSGYARPIWMILKITVGPYQIILDHILPYQPILDHFGPFGSFCTILDQLCPFWTTLSNFQPFLTKERLE